MNTRIVIISAAILAFVALIGMLMLMRTPPLGKLKLSAREIVVGNHTAGSITKYPGNADGNTSPAGEFLTSAGFPIALAIDVAGNLYVVSDIGNHVLVYAAGTNTQNPPIRTISGPNTELHRPTGVALDRDGNIYVADWAATTNRSAVLKFPSGAEGDVAPIAKIPGTRGVPGSPGAVNTEFTRASGVAVDSSGNIYVLDDLRAQLVIFAPGANGDVSPAVVVALDLHFPQQVTLDSDENIYVTHHSTPPGIAIYQAAPIANVSPIRTISSPDIDATVFGIAVDGTGQIFVPNAQQNSLVVFPAGASGSNVTPSRKIQGANTHLNAPLSVAVSILTGRSPSEESAPVAK